MELVPKQLRACDESSLIRTAGLIVHLAVAKLRNNRMTDRKQRQELVRNLALAASI